MRGRPLQYQKQKGTKESVLQKPLCAYSLSPETDTPVCCKSLMVIANISLTHKWWEKNTQSLLRTTMVSDLKIPRGQILQQNCFWFPPPQKKNKGSLDKLIILDLYQEMQSEPGVVHLRRSPGHYEWNSSKYSKILMILRSFTYNGVLFA